MPEKRVTIVHPDGREYSIEPKAFTDAAVSPEGSYAARSFQIVSYVGGEPYGGPKTLAEIEAATAPSTPLPTMPKRSARNVPTAPGAEKGEAE